MERVTLLSSCIAKHLAFSLTPPRSLTPSPRNVPPKHLICPAAAVAGEQRLQWCTERPLRNTSGRYKGLGKSCEVHDGGRMKLLRKRSVPAGGARTFPLLSLLPRPSLRPSFRPFLGWVDRLGA
ncbi:hypothetical protein E2C01_077787 [Portunus trituberculatus]|uniref:Uncharacterized protein n=1 Tax=Portunus trituberculatus TaxID=210409 RepID=A0A5B7IN81_PORTR|nr:hypothetical protein [Portunus trituberculatus]